MAMLYGYILSWDSLPAKVSSPGKAEKLRASLEQNSDFRTKDNQKINLLRRWSVYYFYSVKPLFGEDEAEPRFALDTPYEYPVFFRVNERTGTVIIASFRYTITDAAIASFNLHAKPNMRRKVVNVQALSDRLMSGQKQPYAVTYLMADVSGYGALLRTMSLHGDDLAGADFLAEEQNNLTPRQLGVRPIQARYECGRFSNTGSVQFRMENVSELEGFLSYALKNELYIG